MSKVFFISDLHFDHKGILAFSREYRQGKDIKEHNEWIIDCWNSVVTKQDTIWVLGDVCFSLDSLKLFNKMPGNKQLVRGNHDRLSTIAYLKYFNNVFGFTRQQGFWLSHAPVHPTELRGRRNIHGHVHQNTLPDDRYINVSVEALAGIPISVDQIIERYGPAIFATPGVEA